MQVNSLPLAPPGKPIMGFKTYLMHVKATDWKVKVKVAQLCLTLCDPMDCTVHGILQARILEYTAFPFSRGSFQPRDRTQFSPIAGILVNSRISMNVCPTECMPPASGTGGMFVQLNASWPHTRSATVLKLVARHGCPHSQF